MSGIDEYIASFDEEPGYLDFARFGPPGRIVEAEVSGQMALMSRARFGSLESLMSQDERMRDALAAVTGFSSDQVVFQPNTSEGLMHAMFGLTGAIALSPYEYPSLTYAAQRASEALGVLSPIWLETDHGRVTPGNIRDQLTSSTVAVAVSLVDYRTGYLADLDGIRQVIGDRMLIVDAIQGFGVVEAPLEVADVVACAGYKWTRAGVGTGFLALSDRAAEQLIPVWSGHTGADTDDVFAPRIAPPIRGAEGFTVSRPDPIAQARLAAALEQIAQVGVGAIRTRVTEAVSHIIDIADEYAIPVISSRDERERAGIVVLEPAADQLTVLAASLHNHGVSATFRHGTLRLSAHATTTAETLAMLRAAFLSFSTATNV
ncbi:aminotransferase class V-fold PLP-dependent enzyme [Diaminobutyricimonas sp. TR449]|uniref:aminotransferase class V-fold PLP-dependent enzyme n=1 Tax=Diaminobutyricimonas sp. TR449 TaxID=2708076 RepID=UPI0014231E12|nr:aminotransferase class V-fold PLP-dependent enzyme [Diaminobutyricimonas sp. TR449]